MLVAVVHVDTCVSSISRASKSSDLFVKYPLIADISFISFRGPVIPSVGNHVYPNFLSFWIIISEFPPLTEQII